MPPSDRNPVDISGLKDALAAKQVDVCEEIAEAKATLKELREKGRRGEDPTKADMFAAQMAIKTLQGAAMLIKARPELTGKSAGRASGAELLAADSKSTSSSQSNKDDKAAMLPPPKDFGSEDY